MDSTSESESSVVNSGKVCFITKALITSISHEKEDQYGRIQSLDLHIRDPRLGKIRTIENLSLLPNLMFLNLSYNAITKIEGLRTLVKLVELNLAENAISEIQNLQTLVNLEKLNLSGNRISRLPESMSCLKSLSLLRIARNELSTISDLLVLGSLNKLTAIRIDENPISKQEGCAIYSISVISSLENLNGHQISAEDRLEARRKYQLVAENISSVRPMTGRSSQVAQLGSSDEEGHPTSRIRPSIPPPPAPPPTQASTTRRSSDEFSAQRADDVWKTRASNLLPPQSQSTNYPISGQQPFIQSGSSTASASSREFPVKSSQFEHAGSVSQPRLLDQPDVKEVMDLNARLETLGSKLLSSEQEKAMMAAEVASTKKHLHDARAALEAMSVGHGLAPGVSSDLGCDDYSATKSLISTLKAELETARSKLREATDVQDKEQSTRAKLQYELDDVKQQLVLCRDELSRVRGEARDWELRYRTKENSGGDMSARVFEHSIGTDSQFAQSGLQQQVAELKNELSRVQHDLETSLAQITAANAQNAELSRKLSRAESELTARTIEFQSKEKLISSRSKADDGLEQEVLRLNEVLKDELARRMRGEEELKVVKVALQKLDQDMAAYMSASKRLVRRDGAPAIGRTVYPPRFEGYATPTQQGDDDDDDGDDNDVDLSRTTKANYLDISSTPSSVDPAPNTRRSIQPAESGPNRLPFSNKPHVLKPLSLGRLEQVAAESLAHVMIEELKRPSEPSGKTEGHMKEACVRAALRLVHSASKAKDGVAANRSTKSISRSRSRSRSRSKSRKAGSDASSESDGEVDLKRSGAAVSSLADLGDRDALAQFIADTQAGVEALEDISLLKEEKNQIQKLVDELSSRIPSLESTIHMRTSQLKDLDSKCLESQGVISDRLQDIQRLDDCLQAKRDELERLSSQFIQQSSELESSRRELRESLSAANTEHQNIAAARSRLDELRGEISKTDAALTRYKAQVNEEQERFRRTQLVASDQLRVLQGDLQKIQTDFKNRQRAVEELEKYRKSLDDEILIRRGDLDNQLRILNREVDEENRKLGVARSELRAGRLEFEQLNNSRRQLEADLARLSDCANVETSKLLSEEAEVKRRLEGLEKVLVEAERKARAAREKVSGLDNEATMLQHTVEDLRRQQTELERTADARRRAVQDELSLAQAQAQAAARASRQSQVQIDQKKAELESLSSECRSQERRLEEVKRQVRDFDDKNEEMKNCVKELESMKDRIRREMEQAKKVEDDAKVQYQILRASIDSESKSLDDCRRRLVEMHEEDSALREDHSKLKNALIVLRKSLGESKSELDECRATAERERRCMADLRVKREALESDISRFEEEHKFVLDRISNESKRFSESESIAWKMREQLQALQKELIGAKRKLEDTSRAEEAFRQRELELKVQHDKLRSEAMCHSNTVEEEKRRVDELRHENRTIVQELKQVKEELLRAQQERISWTTSLESVKAQSSFAEQVKDALNAEISRLRDTGRIEIARLESVEAAYNEASGRLKQLRSDLSRIETTYEKAKAQSVEEEGRVQEQRRALKSATDELLSIERAITEATSSLHDERSRALQEIGSLGQAKQSAQSHMFMLNEAQKRVDRRGPSMPSTLQQNSSQGGMSVRRSHSPDLMQQRSLLDGHGSALLVQAGLSAKSQPPSQSDPVLLSSSLGTAFLPTYPPPATTRLNLMQSVSDRGFDAAVSSRSSSSKTNRDAMPGADLGSMELKGLQAEIEKLRLQSDSVMRSAGILGTV